jgi:hypothetical protein
MEEPFHGNNKSPKVLKREDQALRVFNRKQVLLDT